MNHLRYDWIWVRFAWIGLSYNPGGQETRESNRLINELGILKLSLIGELRCTDLFHFALLTNVVRNHAQQVPIKLTLEASIAACILACMGV